MISLSTFWLACNVRFSLINMHFSLYVLFLAFSVLVSALPSPNRPPGISPADITEALDNEHNAIYELLAVNPPVEVTPIAAPGAQK